MEQNKPGCLTRFLSGLAFFTAFVILVATICAYFGQYWYYFDLASHLRVHYIAVLALCILIFIIANKKFRIFVCLILIAVNVMEIYPLYKENKVTPFSAEARILKIVSINVNTSNLNYEKVVDYIKKIDPDVLVLLEIDNLWYRALEPILTTYKYRKTEPRDDNFGMGMFSKLDTNIVKTSFGLGKTPAMYAETKIEEKSITFAAVHVLPPVRESYFLDRNANFDDVAAYVKNIKGEVVLVGDLNTSPWSYYFKKFTGDTGLLDSEIGFGLQPSWNAQSMILRIPVDHCLTSPGIAVLKRELGPAVGSDHYPLYLELGIK